MKLDVRENLKDQDTAQARRDVAADRHGIAIGLLYVHQLTSSPSTVSKDFRLLPLVDGVGFELFTLCFVRWCLIAAEC